MYDIPVTGFLRLLQIIGEHQGAAADPASYPRQEVLLVGGRPQWTLSEAREAWPLHDVARREYSRPHRIGISVAK